MSECDGQESYTRLLARCRSVDQIMKANPWLIERYNELLDQTLMTLSGIEWLEEVLAKVDCGYMPVYLAGQWAEEPETQLCGYYAAANDAHGHFIIHCLTHNEKLWWLQVLCHELRHLWQQVLGGVALQQERDNNYWSRSYEQDALEQSQVVCSLEQAQLSRLDREATELETALVLASKGYPIGMG